MAMQFPIRVSTSTLNRYIKAKIEPIYRKSVLLGLLKARGSIKYNMSGAPNVVVPVRWLRRGIRDVSGPVTSTTFPNTSTYVHAAFGWAGYDLGESITKLEVLVNKSSEVQIYNLLERVISELAGDFTEQWRLRLWQDGNITGTGLMGILSMFGGSSTPTGPVDSPIYNGCGTYTPLKISTSTNWWACAPSATYGGISTALGAKVNDYVGSDGLAAGASVTNFPVGNSFSPGYNFYSPLMVDYNSHQFNPNPAMLGTGSSFVSGGVGIHSWDTQWQQSFNALTTYMNILQSTPVDLVVLDPDLYRRAEDSMIAQQRFVVVESSQTRSLGFKSVEYNGTELMSEFGVPAGMGFALNFSKLHYYALQGDLMEKEEDEDIVTSESLKKISSYGQLWADSPAYFGALVPGVAAGT
jgi:hypothetical protein